jgi:hypothetical protein
MSKTKTMVSKYKKSIFLVFVVLAASILGYFWLNPSPPAPHQQIINQITVYEPYRKLYATPKCIEVSANNQMLSVLPGTNWSTWSFSANKTYTRTTWLFYINSGGYSDIQVMVKMWGPGNDGKTYGVGISSASGAVLDVTIMGKQYVMDGSNSYNQVGSGLLVVTVQL